MYCIDDGAGSRRLSALLGDIDALAAGAPDSLSNVADLLGELAGLLDEAAHQHLTLGSGWKEMTAAAESAIDRARLLKRQWVDHYPFDEESVTGLQQTVSATARKLSSLAERLVTMDRQGRLAETQSTAGNIEHTLVKAATIGVGLGDQERLAGLTSIGHLLRSVETRTIYMDGGRSA